LPFIARDSLLRRQGTAESSSYPQNKMARLPLLALVLTSVDALSMGLRLAHRVYPTQRSERHELRMAVIEAYDLIPMISCLQKSSGYPEVIACLDTIAPWLQITDGSIVFSETAVAGFIGGTVGVMGSLSATLRKRDEVKERLKCPYCEGSGQLVCGRCLGAASVKTKDGMTTTCTQCDGTGTVICINCQGTGVSVPEDILQKLGDTEVGFTEEDYIGLFEEVKFPTLLSEIDEDPNHAVKAAGTDAVTVGAREPEEANATPAGQSKGAGEAISSPVSRDGNA